MITLRADLVDQLEMMAQNKGETVNAMIEATLRSQVSLTAPVPADHRNWMLGLAYDMENADLEWVDAIDYSKSAREAYHEYLDRKWERTQQSGGV